MEKFAVGQAVRRREDERFLTGGGQYLDDIVLGNMCHAAVVRSPHAHAKILGVDTSDAQAAEGVVAVFSAEDYMKEGYGPFPTLTAIDGVDEHGVRHPERHALTGDVARFVGDAIALVVAETRQQAKDAAELVMVEFEDLEPVTDLATVLDEETPVIWPDLGAGNLCYTFFKGDLAKTDAAIEAAAHVVELDLVNNRLAPSAIEPRGAIGDWNAEDGQHVLYVSGQAVHAQKGQMAAAIFKVDPEKIRVIGPDVGGGFGAKNFVYPENVLVMWAAWKLGRPVKWVAERGENFLSEIHGRDHLTRTSLALDADGRFTALKVETIANMGAYLSSFATIIPTSASWVVMGGIYDIPTVAMEVKSVFTNTVPVDAYRGAGRPEAAYIIERLVDMAARQTGIDRLELRRKNLIRSFPYKTALGMEIDCGAFEQNLDLAAKTIGLADAEKRRKQASRNGKLHGFGVATYLEVTLGNPVDATEVRFEDDGSVTLLAGTQSTGQGHETAYMQILESRLGIPQEKVSFVQGDTDLVASGGGHGGSRSLAIGGTALHLTAAEIIEKGLKAAAHVLEENEDAISFGDGLFSARGTNKSISVLELQNALQEMNDLPDDIPASLSTKGSYEREAFNYPNGTHIAEVEVDPDTGKVDLVGYAVTDDFGHIVNPLIAEGQIIGGSVQGIGQAMLEGVEYDPESGQLLTGSYMDYCMPRADDLPAIQVGLNQDAPTKTNPMGVKGAGEAGATGAPPAVVNAVCDALSEYGISHIDMPLTSEKVWRAIRSAGT
ncbi:MAG: xanthine dehydrogenase family protein molybdopterin-binding subunit [Pseudomonadota bacterium]